MEVIEKQPHSKAFLEKRRLAIVIPLLVLPFVTALFWLIGGGSGDTQEKEVKVEGINTTLPNAENATDSTLDKMAFYRLAEKDSTGRANLIDADPYLESFEKQYYQDSVKSAGYQSNYSTAPTTGQYTGAAYNDPNEAKIQEKLAKLNEALNTASKPQEEKSNSLSRDNSSGMSSADIDRLEAMMSIQNSGTSADPEMQQISTMLNQILDIQHPERIKEKIRESSEKAQGQVFAVTGSPKPLSVSLLHEEGRQKDSSALPNSFFSLNDPATNTSPVQNTIEAVIHETRTLVNGAIVKLRLLNDIYINGDLIPKNTLVFGECAVSGERLNININNIRYGNSIYPVKLGIYDLDGLSGVYVPGAISRDVAKGSADQAIQSMTLGANSIDPSIGLQAAGMGIEAAKGLLSKKVKLIKVTVKAGYRVLLKDENQKSNN